MAPINVHVEFPLWVVTPPESAKVEEIAKAITRGGVKCALLFSDEISAKEFRDSSEQFRGNVVRPIIDLWHLIGLLTLFEKTGFANVIIDPSPCTDSRPTGSGRGLPLVEFRDELEKMVL